MGEGFEAIIFNPHILKHHIPEHPRMSRLPMLLPGHADSNTNNSTTTPTTTTTTTTTDNQNHKHNDHIHHNANNIYMFR